MSELPHACEQMRYAANEPTLPIDYSPRYRTYGVEYAGGGSIQQMTFCPFCGATLPPTLHELWFDRLEALGIDPGADPIPDAFQTDRWWRDAGV